MEKSLCIEMVFTEAPFEDRFRLAKQAGFDYVEFWSWQDKDIHRIKALCRENGLQIASFSGDQVFSMIDGTQKADYVSFASASMETANFLGCDHLVIHSNALGENGVVIDSYPDVSEVKKIAAMLDALQTLAPMAEAAQVTLVLEALNTLVDHPGNFLKRTRDAAELIRAVDSPNVKILYDVYHMQIMEGNLIDTLRETIDTIGYIHAADVPGRHEPGTGEINFDNLMAELRALGYHGVVGFELSPLNESRKAVEAILKL